MKEPEIEVKDLEELYDALADNIDQVNEDKRLLYLTKLALLLGASLNDRELTLAAMKDAAKDLS